MKQLVDVRTVVIAASLTLGLSTGALAQPVTDIGMDPEDSTFGRKEYSPYLNQSFPQRVFWGETHVHTSYSTDAVNTKGART